MEKPWLLFVCVIGIVLLGSLSGMLSMGYLVPYSGINAQLWYKGLNKLIDVPAIVFPVVWTALYILMAVSLYLVLVTRRCMSTSRALRLFYIQLFLNLIWSVIFFGLRLPLVALIEMVVLLVSIVLYMRMSYHVSKIASYLMIPYAVWVVFALFLNLTIVVMN
jgi:translocator protein